MEYNLGKVYRDLVEGKELPLVLGRGLELEEGIEDLLGKLGKEAGKYLEGSAIYLAYLRFLQIRFRTDCKADRNVAHYQLGNMSESVARQTHDKAALADN
jgi:hypothetical protein